MRRPLSVALLAGGAAAWLLAACGGEAAPAADDGVVRYVGSAACAACHEGAAGAWRESHHAWAMQPATAPYVLGDFADATLAHRGAPAGPDAVAVARFRRDGARYLVRTHGADGVERDFEVQWAFGVRPLQQYLVAGADGRLQVLPFCWDSRPEDAGGQRWFRLHPEDWMPPGDLLHWAGPQGEWNYLCADCHATDLQRRWDPAREAYDTRWSEAGVGCEACHGPGSAHLAWAERQAAGPDTDRGLTVRLGDADGGAWHWDEASLRPVREPARVPDAELEVCAACHARRTPLVDGITPGAPFLDQFVPAFLEPGLYESDGQIRDEVYVWGSFLQSRMHQAGVTCNDCHEPHGAGLRAPGDALCVRCHDAGRYDGPAHDGHPAGGAGSECVDCHMPTRTYMEVDPRRDHAFRVPRPDLAKASGAASACLDCHAERDEAWAAAEVAGWRAAAGRPPDLSTAREAAFGPVFRAAERGDPQAARELAAMVEDSARPPLLRASALLRLAALGSARVEALLPRAAADPAPLLRLAAARAAAGLRSGEAFVVVEPLLRDPLRAVRVEAVRAVLPLFVELESGAADPRLLDALLAESAVALAQRGGRAEGRFAAGVQADLLGRTPQAEAQYRAALAADPLYVPAAINLADLLRRSGRDAEGRGLLEALLERGPTPLPAAAAADLRHALGLTLVRAGEEEAALGHLAAAAGSPDAPARYGYVLGVALLTAARAGAALEAFDQALERHPWSPELLQGAADAADASGLDDVARGYRERLAAALQLRDR